ncbi:MAG: TIGR02391 family protein [Oscillospiraceae bacterium]|jgi:uncharacterized protein (TIGR02391 family)|nr:TIGR02391 family protein [Oscillospiraceae bacterium]
MNQYSNFPILSQETLTTLCGVIAETSKGLTKKELSVKLGQCGIFQVDDGNRNINNGYSYNFGLNKRDWLYNCFINELNTNRTMERIYAFIENALNPVNYTDITKRDQYKYLLEETNKILLLNGLKIQNNGKIKKEQRAETLDEVDKRVNSLQQKLHQRAIHSEVTKYCIKDYLREDYYDAVFEASKGLAQRVREITGLTEDGNGLFQKAFATNDPYLFMNTLTTQSEKSEHNGLSELLQAIFHLVRNPAAHTPKINWKTDEVKALDILTVISLAHKYLDECNKMPNK